VSSGGGCVVSVPVVEASAEFQGNNEGEVVVVANPENIAEEENSETVKTIIIPILDKIL
jgi:hypothetical protein